MVQGPYAGSPPKTYYSPGGFDNIGAEQPAFRPWEPQQPIHTEMPTDMHAQGWASSESHPVPYEMDGSTVRGSQADRY